MSLQIPVLKTERLVIRSLERSDATFLLNHYRNRDIFRFMLISFNTEEEAEDFIIQSHSDPNKIRLGLDLVDENKLIGTISLLDWSEVHKSLEIGFDICPGYWRKGYMFEASTAVLNYCFENLEINRVEATTSIENFRSFKLLQKLGFQMEGILREKYFFLDRFQDEFAFAMLKSDWKKMPY